MNEDPTCTDCILHRTAKHRCLSSQGDVNCRLAIFLDSPAYIDDKRGKSFVSDNAEFVRYCLNRMSVPESLVYLDYIVKCYPKKLPGQKADRMACVNACSQYRLASLQKLKKLRSLVVLGSLGCETFTMEKQIGLRQGTDWVPASPLVRQIVPRVWVGFSPGLLENKPSEAGSIYRVIYIAAEEAGLKPQTNLKIKPYEFTI